MERISIVSGGFDPLHVGHIALFEAAAEHGDKLVVLVNSDEWLSKKKGYSVMSQEDRMKIIESLGMVDEVFMASDEDGTVVESLKLLKEDAEQLEYSLCFVNGGDRLPENSPETQFCLDNGIEVLFGAGGKKIRSSSEMVDNKLMKVGCKYQSILTDEEKQIQRELWRQSSQQDFSKFGLGFTEEKLSSNPMGAVNVV